VYVQTTCRKSVMAAVSQWPLSMCNARMDFGTISVHETLENSMAEFVGKEAAIVYSMGYGTNTSTIATLVDKGGLIISDSLNHTSIVNGSRNSQAMIRVFKNNDMKNLEEGACLCCQRIKLLKLREK
jgi:serine palmitoyltransferase